MVISARHLMATRANLRIAHEKQQEKNLWKEEYGVAGHVIVIILQTHKPGAMAASTAAVGSVYIKEDRRHFRTHQLSRMGG